MFCYSRGELIRPVEMCLFYRSKFQSQLSEYASHAVPVNFYFRAKEVDRATSNFLFVNFHLGIILPSSNISHHIYS